MLVKKTIKVIVLPPDVKKEIAAEVGCTVETVYNALNLTNPTVGEQPDRIRSVYHIWLEDATTQFFQKIFWDSSYCIPVTYLQHHFLSYIFYIKFL